MDSIWIPSALDSDSIWIRIPFWFVSIWIRIRIPLGFVPFGFGFQSFPFGFGFGTQEAESPVTASPGPVTKNNVKYEL